MRFAFIHAEKASFPVSALCGLLEVTRQGYYAFARRPPSRRVLAEAELCEAIRKVFADSRETYGSPRVLRDRFRCNVCSVRMPWVVEGTPCPGCKSGTLRPWSDDDVRRSRYVQRLVDDQLVTLVAGEHTAQVTGDKRIELEGEFKDERRPLNVLSCSPRRPLSGVPLLH